MKGTRWGLHVAALTGLALLLWLGTWQLDRLHWKEQLLEMIERLRTEPDISLSEAERRFSEFNNIDYTPVKLSGTFENANAQFFFATHQGQSGWFVHVPMKLVDGRAILVNRGFIPYDAKDKLLPADRSATIHGLARNPVSAKPSRLLPDNDLKGKIFYWKDLTAMAANAGLDPARTLPFFVDDWSLPPQKPFDTQTTIVELPNNHMQYALTWYGLAAALACVWGVMIWRRPSSPPSNDGRR